MTRIREDFDGSFGVAIKDGDSLTTGNTFINTTGGGAGVADSDCVLGNHSYKLTLAGGLSNPYFLAAAALDTTAYMRFFFKFTAAPSGGTVPCIVPQSGSTNRCQFGITTAGKITIRSPAVVQATSTNAYINQWVRIEWDMTGSTQTMRIYAGAQLLGNTATETLTGAITVTGGWDKIRFGTTSADTWTLWYDGVEYDTVAQPSVDGYVPDFTRQSLDIAA